LYVFVLVGTHPWSAIRGALVVQHVLWHPFHVVPQPATSLEMTARQSWLVLVDLCEELRSGRGEATASGQMKCKVF
jgi:hypothetical protein